METKKKITYWFVEPLDAFTNEAIAKFLAESSDVSTTIALKLKDGRVCSAFQLPNYSLVSKLYASKSKFGFKFRIYRRQGSYGQVVEWKFGK
jgi:hypothetical protein